MILKKILILANSPGGLYRFRKELIQSLIEEGNEVCVSVPYDEVLKPLELLGVKIINTKIDRRGINPLRDSFLILKYLKIIKKVNPDCIITYTIKPNIYGSIISRIFNIPYIVNITGLGSVFQHEGLLRNLVIYMYRVALKAVKYVIFENIGNQKVFIDEEIIPENKSIVLKGAGVNLDDFKYEEYPKDDCIKFLFIGRVMKEKGIEELFQVARDIRKIHSNVEFIILGSLEEDYKSELNELESKGIVTYLGYQNDVRPFIKDAHCIILPSYHEGMSNTLLETGAMGRPLITSNIHGCKEAVIDNESGLLCEKANYKDLKNAVETFLSFSVEQRREMAMKSYEHIALNFDKKLIVKQTMDLFKNIF